LIARSPVLQPSPVLSLRSQMSELKLDLTPDDDDESPGSRSEQMLFTQVRDWLQQEQAKRPLKANGSGTSSAPLLEGVDNPTTASHERRQSQASDRAVALDSLEKILAQYATTIKEQTQRNRLRRRRSSRARGLRRGSASDSDYFDTEAGVPRVDAALDNSKTLGYSGGAAGDESAGDAELQIRHAKDKENWLVFKTEILRLAHTLKLKRWRRVPMECSGDIEVTRLSGALTNAVYVVVPPKNIPHPKNPDGTPNLAPRRPPP
jgi:choline kinase